MLAVRNGGKLFPDVFDPIGKDTTNPDELIAYQPYQPVAVRHGVVCVQAVLVRMGGWQPRRAVEAVRYPCR